MIMNNKGAVTVKLVIMIVGIISVFSVLLQGLVIGFNSNQNLRNNRMLSDHILSHYDTYLFVNYGLYGVTSYETTAGFKHSLALEIQPSVKLTDDLKQIEVLQRQINSYMKLRLPVNYMDQILSKLEVIKKAKATQDSIDLKTVIDTALNDLGHIFDDRIEMSVKVNTLNHNLIDSWQREVQSYKVLLDIVKEEYMELNLTLELLNARVFQLNEKLSSVYEIDKSYLYEQVLSLEKEIRRINKLKRSVMDDGRELVQAYNEIVDSLISFEKTNETLVDTIISVAEKTESIEKLIEQTQLMIADEKDGLLVVKEALIESLEDSRDSLYKNELKESKLDGDFIAFMNAKNTSIDKRWYPAIQIPYRNMILLRTMNQRMTYKDIKSFIDGTESIELIDFTVLDSYQCVSQFPVNKTDSNLKSYYDEQKYIQDRTYEVAGKVTIDRKLSYNDKTKGSFWTSALLETGKVFGDSVIINEYILSTFKSYGEPSDTDFDYFNKYDRNSYFVRGEIEYILMGEDSEGYNVMETTGIIIAVRTVMNGIHIYTDKEKLALSESIGVSVAGWTGFGGPLVSNVIRVCWATGESFYDIRQLIKGEGVPFYKIYSDQWHYDLGLAYEEENIPEYLKLMDLTYHDYLRLMLLTVSNEVKLKRIVNLIELNLYSCDRPFDLSLYYTKVIISESFERGYYDRE